MPAVAAPADPVIYGPPGYNFRRAVARLRSVRISDSRHVRLGLCERSPLMFALIYLPHCLSSDDTKGRLSFSEFHLAIAEAGKECMRRDLGIAESRWAWIAPRGSAKSTWSCLIIPLWALAFGHRKFAITFSNGGDIARKHLAAFVKEIKENPVLRADFPDLCKVKVANNEMFLSRSGAVYVAKGMDASTLGMKVGNQRPDYVSLDDCEPKAADYNSTTRQNRLTAITDAIFPMNLNAVVHWSATTTAYGSLAHDLVRAAVSQGSDVAEWIAAENFRIRYYPAIIVDPDGSERSLWPQRWSLEELQVIRAKRKRTYALNYNNQPVGEDGTFWEADHFRYDPNFPAHAGVLSIDPAVTAKSTSDYSGISVVATDISGRRVCVMDARQVKLLPDGLHAEMLRVLRLNPWINEVIIEDNQGKETWRSILSRDLPAHVKLTLYPSRGSKALRYANALELWERGLVTHRTALPAFEDQALAYPNVVHDDVLDSTTAAVLHYLRDSAA